MVVEHPSMGQGLLTGKVNNPGWRQGDVPWLSSSLDTRLSRPIRQAGRGR
jgi:hypothetical protein